MTSAFNLEERTTLFAKNIINLSFKISRTDQNRILINQVVRSGTSIGANYREASETDSKKDFRNKIRLTKKECKETMYWLDLLKEYNPPHDLELSKLIDESMQLMKIFGAIFQKTQ